MPALSKKITIDRGNKKIYIDGVEFPWIISTSGPEVDHVAEQYEIPSVTLTIPTVDLEIIPAEKGE